MAEEIKIRVNEQVSTVAADRDTPLLYVLTNELRLQGPRSRMREYPMTPYRVRAVLHA